MSDQAEIDGFVNSLRMRDQRIASLEHQLAQQIQRGNDWRAECEQSERLRVAAERRLAEALRDAECQRGNADNTYARWVESERQLETARAALEEIVAAHTENAARVDKCLERREWRPNRSHIEYARNAFAGTAKIARAALAKTEGEP